MTGIMWSFMWSFMGQNNFSVTFSRCWCTAGPVGKASRVFIGDARSGNISSPHFEVKIEDTLKPPRYPLVNVHILPWKISIFYGKIHYKWRNQHAINGKIHYFDWAIFKCYVSSPEGRSQFKKSVQLLNCPFCSIPRPLINPSSPNDKKASTLWEKISYKSPAFLPFSWVKNHHFPMASVTGCR